MFFDAVLAEPDSRRYSKTRQRRKLTAEQKVTIVRKHLQGKESVTSSAEDFAIHSTQIHDWFAMVLTKIEHAFEKTAKVYRVAKIAEAIFLDLKER